MRKTILLGALALAASTAAAGAATTIALDGFCNAYTIRNSASQLAMIDTGCSSGYGMGMLANVRGSGKTAIMGLTDPTTDHTQFVFRFSYPFVTGGTWSLSDTTNGKTVNALAGGNYTVTTGGQPALKGTHSVTSAK